MTPIYSMKSAHCPWSISGLQTGESLWDLQANRKWFIKRIWIISSQSKPGICMSVQAWLLCLRHRCKRGWESEYLEYLASLLCFRAGKFLTESDSDAAYQKQWLMSASAPTRTTPEGERFSPPLRSVPVLLRSFAGPCNQLLFKVRGGSLRGWVWSGPFTERCRYRKEKWFC